MVPLYITWKNHYSFDYFLVNEHGMIFHFLCEEILVKMKLLNETFYLNLMFQGSNT